jgi:DNA repair protein RadC
LQLKLGEAERELFACLFLDNRHRLIQYEELFYGTIDGASVHPKEVVKGELKHEAATFILVQTHPQ